MKNNFIFNFKKKNILITGGAGPLGIKLVDAFLSLNANLIIVDKITKDKKDFVRKYSKKLLIINTDLSKKNEILKMIKKIKKLNKLDCLINNAAFSLKIKSKKFTGQLKDQTTA